MTADFSNPKRSRAEERQPWHGAAFVVEALVLLAFLAAALAVTMQATGAAYERGSQSDLLANAVILASNEAESFAANPTSEDTSTFFTSVNGTLTPIESAFASDSEQVTGKQPQYQVMRSVRAEEHEAGILYFAHIAVLNNGATTYELDTSRYVSDEEAIR